MGQAQRNTYNAWIENDYDNQATADAIGYQSPTSVRGRVAEYLNEAVPKLWDEGLTAFQIAERLRLPDTKRVLSRLPNKPTNVYPQRKNRYDDIIESLPMRQLPEPIAISGNAIITGDWQLPTTDYEFMKRIMHIGLLELESPRKLIIAGDFLNNDAFSGYDDTVPSPRFNTEIKACKRVLDDLLRVFDEVVIFMGNHERRSQRKTKGQLTAELLFTLITTDERVTVSPHGFMELTSNGELYRVTHAKNYSVNQLTVADALAHKELCHIIQHHEHHLAIGYDRYKNFLIINNGGVFSQQDMAYVVIDDSKHANMANGFTMVKDGVPTLYGKYPFTDWTSTDAEISAISPELPKEIQEVI